MLQEKNPKKGSNKFLKYTSLAFQLGSSILLFTYLGLWLDDKYPSDQPWFTIFLSLGGVIIGLYLSLKPLIKDEKEE